MKVILSHGKESSPQSTKILRLKERVIEYGHEVEVPDYREIPSPEDRAAHLLEHLNDKEIPTILVGSSMGAYISLVASARCEAPIRGLFLMAPAFYLSGYEVQNLNVPDCPVEIIHGWQDDVVPFQNAIRFSGEAKCRLLMVNDNHRLSNSIEEIDGRFVRFLKALA